jgi:heptosyltransferase-2
MPDHPQSTPLHPGPGSDLRLNSGAGNSPRQILVRSVNWLGDAVMTTPALQRLGQRFPEARITLLTPGKLARLWDHHPNVHSVITFARGQSPLAVARKLRGRNFDLALVLPNSPRSALEVWLAGIPGRVGYAQTWRNWLLTTPVAPRGTRVVMAKRSAHEVKRLIRAAVDHTQHATRNSVPADPAESGSSVHQVHQYLHLAAAVGADATPLPPVLIVTRDEMETAQATWRGAADTEYACGREPILLGLNPTAAYGPAKRWPVEKFAAVVREVSRNHRDCQWLVFGNTEDRQLCEEISRPAHGRGINLAGKTSLRELMALLKLCRVVLTNDSGPMHVAAALGIPVVVPFGSTSPELTGPGLPGDNRHRLLRSGAACSPCFRRICPIDFRCMNGITVEQVVAAVVLAL